MRIYNDSYSDYSRNNPYLGYSRNNCQFNNIIRDKIREFVIKLSKPIEVYRWLINFCCDIKNLSIDKFTIKTMISDLNPRIKNDVINNMRKHDYEYEQYDRFDYVVCDGIDGRSRYSIIGNKIFDINFLRLRMRIRRPLKIDYYYYINNLESINQVLLRLGHHPENDSKLYNRFIKNPIRTIANFTRNDDLKSLLNEIERVFGEELTIDHSEIDIVEVIDSGRVIYPTDDSLNDEIDELGLSFVSYPDL